MGILRLGVEIRHIWIPLTFATCHLLSLSIEVQTDKNSWNESNVLSTRFFRPLYKIILANTMKVVWKMEVASSLESEVSFMGKFLWKFHLSYWIHWISNSSQHWNRNLMKPDFRLNTEEWKKWISWKVTSSAIPRIFIQIQLRFIVVSDCAIVRIYSIATAIIVGVCVKKMFFVTAGWLCLDIISAFLNCHTSPQPVSAISVATLLIGQEYAWTRSNSSE